MKKHKKNTFDKNKKAAAGAALGVAAAAAGIAAVAGGKDVESEEVANDENAEDSQTERGLEEAAASAAGQMADDVANVEQAPLDSDTSEMSAVSNDIIVDDDVIIVENSTEPISDDVDVMVVESTDGPAFVEPAAPEPAVVEHVAAEPAAPEPVTVEPVTVEPVVMEPVVQNEPMTINRTTMWLSWKMTRCTILVPLAMATTMTLMSMLSIIWPKERAFLMN